ncbi:MAG: alpha/beta hydrolase [Bacteroidota bacterium]
MTKRFSVEMGSAIIDGVEAGTGEPLIFLHAGVADKRMWMPQIEFFSNKYHTIAYDRRGFGKTKSPDEAFSHLNDLQTIIDFKLLPPAILVGCSQGGRIALDFALKYPDQVKKLVLISPAISGQSFPDTFPEPAQTFINELDVCEDFDRINQLEAFLWLDGAVSNPNRVDDTLRNLFLDMNGIALDHPDFNHEIEPDSAMEMLADINVPALVLWGNLDFPSLGLRCQNLVQSMKNATGYIIEGTAHLPGLEKPGVVNKLISEFLR